MYSTPAHSRSTTRTYNKKQRKRQGEFTLYVPPSIGVMPDRLKTTLKWWMSPPINLLAQNWALQKVNANGAYDPDPASGTTVPSGFAQLAAIYQTYRPYRGRIRVEVINPDPAVPVTVVVCPTNLDQVGSANRVIQLVQQPYAVKGIVSTQGSPPLILANEMTTEKLYGSPTTRYDDYFSALTNNNPANIWHWMIGFYAPAVHSVSAVVCNIFIEMDIEFYDRKVLDNNAPSATTQTSLPSACPVFGRVPK